MIVKKICITGCAALFSCFISTVGVCQSNLSAKRADSLFSIGSWREATQAYEVALKSDSKNGRLLYRLASAYKQQKLFAQAVSAYKKSLEQPSPIPPMFIKADLAKTYSESKDSVNVFSLLKEMVGGGYLNFADLESSAEYSWLRSTSTFAAIIKGAKANAYPCLANPRNKEFDFWVGEWDVFQTGTNYQVGEQRIEKASAGCLVVENWKAYGVPNEGKSINFISPKTNKWEQVWMGSGGQYLNYYNGIYQDAAMHYEGDGVDNAGKKLLFRLTYFNLGSDALRQLLQQSSDDGKTWTTSYDFSYKRK